MSSVSWKDSILEFRCQRGSTPPFDGSPTTATFDLAESAYRNHLHRSRSALRTNTSVEGVAGAVAPVRCDFRILSIEKSVRRDDDTEG